MAEISQLKVGSTTYDIKDTTARNTKLDKAGGTMSGNLTVNAAVTSNSISTGNLTSTGTANFSGSTQGIKLDELDQNASNTVILNCGTSTTSM